MLGALLIVSACSHLGGQATPPPADDRGGGTLVAVPWLGVTVQDVPPAAARYYRLEKSGGAVVTAVDGDGPGARARMERGDLILALDGEDLQGPIGLAGWSGAADRDAVTLKVLRAGSTGDIRVVVKAPPPVPSAKTSSPEAVETPAGAPANPPAPYPEPGGTAEVVPEASTGEPPATVPARVSSSSAGAGTGTPAPVEVAPNAPVPVSNEERALSLYSAGRFAEALEAYLQLAAETPGDAKAQNNVGVVLNLLGRWEEAAAVLKRAVELNPRFAQAHFNRGLAVWNMGRLEEALSEYRSAGDCAPELLVAHLAEADALLQLGRPEEALEANRKVLSLEAGSPEGIRQKGEVLRALGRLAEEEETYRNALLANPKDPDLRLKLAISLDQADEPAQALRVLDELVESGAPNATVYHNRALVRLRLGNAAGALSDAESALKLEPRFPAAQGVRAEALQAMGKLDEATTAWGKALDENPRNLRALKGLEDLVKRIASDSDGIKKIQGWLALIGEDPGLMDGVLGPRTRQALARFQTKQCLRPSGSLNGLTLLRLADRVRRRQDSPGSD